MATSRSPQGSSHQHHLSCVGSSLFYQPTSPSLQKQCLSSSSTMAGPVRTQEPHQQTRPLTLWLSFPFPFQTHSPHALYRAVHTPSPGRKGLNWILTLLMPYLSGPQKINVQNWNGSWEIHYSLPFCFSVKTIVSGYSLEFIHLADLVKHGDWA